MPGDSLLLHICQLILSLKPILKMNHLPDLLLMFHYTYNVTLPYPIPTESSSYSAMKAEALDK